MIIMIVCALVCAFSLSLLLHPLMANKRTRTVVHIIGFIVVAGSLSVYLWRGSPETLSASVAFETDQHRTDVRELMTQLRFQPNNPDLLAKLGQVYFEDGDIERSMVLFEKALSVNSEHLAAREAMGALLFGTGMMMRSQGAKDDDIRPIWDRAYKLAPDTAPYKKTILKHLKALAPPP